MARPREFELEDALTRAMNTFWSYGYEAASLPILLDGMGLTRGSLYKAFTDKKTLFLKVLTQYEAESVRPAVALLTQGSDDGLQRIETLFGSITQAQRGGDERGCLLCSAAAGPAAVDVEIADVVHDQLAQMQAAFDTALSQSAKYAVAVDDHRTSLASMLLTQYVGLRILVRSKTPVKTVDHSVKALIASIS